MISRRKFLVATLLGGTLAFVFARPTSSIVQQIILKHLPYASPTDAKNFAKDLNKSSLPMLITEKLSPLYFSESIRGAMNSKLLEKIEAFERQLVSLFIASSLDQNSGDLSYSGISTCNPFATLREL